jgi:hypothetical protein
MIDTIQFQLLLATFAAWANRRQAGVISYLIEEKRLSIERCYRPVAPTARMAGRMEY